MSIEGNIWTLACHQCSVPIQDLLVSWEDVEKWHEAPEGYEAASESYYKTLDKQRTLPKAETFECSKCHHLAILCASCFKEYRCKECNQ